MGNMSNDIRFVRVQDNLYGMETDAEGNLILKYKRDTKDTNRNTIHFTVNTIVEDHSYGKFNFDSDGNLVGNVVIIANPSEMVAPAALNQVDTWFRYGTKDNERTLNVGKATIVVKEGMEVPTGVNALFFDGTIEDRNRIVKEHFESLNIPMEQCGFRNWVDQTVDSLTWAKNTKEKLYDEKAKYIYVGMHDGSPDGDMERSSIDGVLTNFKNDRERYFNSDSVDIGYLSHMENKAKKCIDDLNEFLSSLPQEEKQRVGKHYETQIENIHKDLKEAREFDKILIKEREINYLNKLVDEFPGIGDFHVANATTKQPIPLKGEELKERIVNGALNGDDHIWRHGFKDQWTTIKNTQLYESMEEIRKLFNIEPNGPTIPNKPSVLDRMSSITENLRNKNNIGSSLKPN
jgi:hypothetical protein